MNAEEIADLTEVLRVAKQRLADDRWAAMSDLHQFLAQLIRDSGVQQRELAERVGFTEKHISQMMHGRSGSIDAWDRLLNAAGVHLCDAFPLTWPNGGAS